MMATVDNKFADPHMSRPPTMRVKNCAKFLYLHAGIFTTDIYKPVQTSTGIINFSSRVNSITDQELSVCVLTRVAQK